MSGATKKPGAKGATMSNELSFLDRRKDWHCAMCGINLEEACHKRFPELYTMNTVTATDYYEAKQEAYIHERTQERPNLTCSRTCGYAYKSWKSTLDSKRTYLVDPFTCDKCHEPATGGRLLKNGNRDYQVCRKCHRKYFTNELRAIWQTTHREQRREYMKAYREKHATTSR
jgi:predicted CXXCH cytochrome family protein